MFAAVARGAQFDPERRREHQAPDDRFLRVVVEETVVPLRLEDSGLARKLAALVAAEAVDDVGFISQAGAAPEFEFTQSSYSRILVGRRDDESAHQRALRDVLQIESWKRLKCPSGGTTMPPRRLN